MRFQTLFFIGLWALLVCQLGFSKTLTVSNESQLITALKEVRSGDAIAIQSGVYTFDKSLNLEKKNSISLYGIGSVKLLLNDTDQNVINIKSCNNINISNISAQHTQPLAEYQCHGSVLNISDTIKITIDGCELNGCGAVGIFAYEVRNMVIKNNLIYNNSFTALYFQYVADVLIKNNVIVNNKNFLEAYNLNQLSMYGNMITNNQGYW